MKFSLQTLLVAFACVSCTLAGYRAGRVIGYESERALLDQIHAMNDTINKGCVGQAVEAAKAELMPPKQAVFLAPIATIEGGNN